MRSFAAGMLPSFARLPLAMTLTLGYCGIAYAVASETSACTTFCSPMAPGQLEHYRAQGLTRPPGHMAVSVILWDEYRRTRAAPADTAPMNGVSAPGGTAFVNTASTIR